MGEKQAKRELAVLTEAGLARFVARPRSGHYELTEDGIAAGGGIPDTVVQ